MPKRLVAGAKKLGAAKDIAAARTAFGDVSAALVAYAEKTKSELGADVRVAYCPMVNKPWLQKDKDDQEPVLRGGDAHVRIVQEAKRRVQRFRLAVFSAVRRIATIPSSGPGTSSSDAHRQPTIAADRGSSSIVTIVSRNPRQVCSVSAVPT